MYAKAIQIHPFPDTQFQLKNELMRRRMENISFSSSKSSADGAKILDNRDDVKFASRKFIVHKLKSGCSAGLLKLEIYGYQSMMTVHIIQARGLSNPLVDKCNSFVQIRICPDQTDRVNCVTSVVNDSNNPLFKEKFSFEIYPQDLKKRLVVAVYHKFLNSHETNLIGLMSFGISHLVLKSKMDTLGWYYLLPEEIGNFKHKKLSDFKLDKRIPLVNQDITGMQRISVIVPRGPNGFGFSIGGNCPCRITRLNSMMQTGAPELKVGDYIVKIGNKNVSRATLDSVVKLIKKHVSHLLLEVYRPQNEGHIFDKAFERLYNNHSNSSSITTGKTTTTTTTTTTSGSDISPTDGRRWANHCRVPTRALSAIGLRNHDRRKRMTSSSQRCYSSVRNALANLDINDRELPSSKSTYSEHIHSEV